LIPALKRAYREAQTHRARAAAERALFQSEENFRQSISESPLGIRIVNMQGDTVYANKAFLRIYDFGSLEEYIQTPAKERYLPESYLQHLERKELRKNGRDILEYELGIVRKDKAIRYVKILRNEVLWDGKRHFQVINQDITEQRKLTIDLIAAKEKAEESDRLKSAFLANMSHEIRTPMNGILGFSSLLSEPGLDGADRSKYIGIIQKSSVRMLNIINEIMDISKIESGLMEVNLKETNINEQIESIYCLMKPDAKQRNIEISCQTPLPASSAIVLTDPEKLYSILTNLVKNAIKYTDQGSIEFGYDVVETRHALSLLQFYVKDTGIGIPLERQEAIFERFVQADIADVQARQGSGLGLTIARAYVQMLKGNIWVKSNPGEGSTFYFTIPYSREENKSLFDQPELHPIGDDKQRKRLNILVVEDDEISSKLIIAYLGKMSESLHLAQSGLEALEIMHNHPEIDLVMMDIRMPGLNGIETTRMIREFNNQVVIVAQTAFGLVGDKERSLEAGCNDWISKPIQKNDLLALIGKYF
jgi:PAS domain S-box-containing protein